MTQRVHSAHPLFTSNSCHSVSAHWGLELRRPSEEERANDGAPAQNCLAVLFQLAASYLAPYPSDASLGRMTPFSCRRDHKRNHMQSTFIMVRVLPETRRGKSLPSSRLTIAQSWYTLAASSFQLCQRCLPRNTAITVLVTHSLVAGPHMSLAHCCTHLCERNQLAPSSALRREDDQLEEDVQELEAEKKVVGFDSRELFGVGFSARQSPFHMKPRQCAEN